MLAAVAIGGGAAAWAASTPKTGSYISFITGANLPSVSIADANGADPHRLAAGGEALLSPNGAYVAIERVASTGPSLEIYSTGGHLLADFFNSAKVIATPVTWSANSRYLAASLSNTSTRGGGALALIDVSTLTSRIVSHGVILGASFKPAGTQLVFGETASQQLSSPADLYVAPAGGGAVTQLTTNGNSMEPVWARTGIIFDRSTPRGVSKAPIYQLWIDQGGKLRQLTHMKVPALQSGLAPLEADADGNRLIAEYGGEDTSFAYTVQLSPLEVKPLRVAGESKYAGQVQGVEISSNGQRLLVDVGGFEQPPNHAEVESVSFAGGTPTKLAHGAEPSWSG
jgi:Tol biopolymer transport system component